LARVLPYGLKRATPFQPRRSGTDENSHGRWPAHDLTLEFDVTAQGAIDADLTGVLRIEGGSSVYLDAQGIFAGDRVDFLLQTEGDEYRSAFIFP
jgi:hypothetical protein